MRHRCGRDCSVCEELAEEHAERQATRSEQEAGDRRAQGNYERHCFGED